MSILLIFAATEVKAAEKKTGWNYKNEVTEKSGAFTYHAITSKDKKKVWIYEISIDTKEDYSILEIPKKIKGKKVVRIGYTAKKDASRMDEYTKNIFGNIAETYHDNDGGNEVTDGVTTITIPNSIEVIQAGAFSGLNSITKIKIPKKVEEIKEDTFYGCDNLETVELSVNLKELDALAFVDCKNLKEVKIPSENKVYKIENQCVITKKDQALQFVLPGNNTNLEILDGIKVLKEFSFSNCNSSVVNIPASVKKIEARAFHKNYRHENVTIKDVTISEKNKVYAKDGQCIYNKKKKTLSVAIPDDEGVLYVSDKVKYITAEYSMVNCDTYEKRLKKVVLPKNLKSVMAERFSVITDAESVYFTSAKPPKIKKTTNTRGLAVLPIHRDVYVPKASFKAYKKWYKQYKCYSSVRLHKYNP